MRTTLVVAITMAMAGLGGATHAVVPPDRVNYQGILRDANDLPRNGSFDMVFRFFTSDVGGNEILVDSHLASGSGAVVVADGLFSVALGGGVVTDGAGVFPGDPYDSLHRAFNDFSEVWLQMEIDSGSVFEVLAPRVRISASPYSLNQGLRRRVVSAKLDNVSNTTWTVLEQDQDPAWITSTTDGSEGIVKLNVAPGIFSGPPNCVCSALTVGTSIIICGTSSTSAAQIHVGTRNAYTTSSEDADFFIVCSGPID